MFAVCALMFAVACGLLAGASFAEGGGRYGILFSILSVFCAIVYVSQIQS